MSIQVEGLSKRYGHREAVRDASFTVHPGRVTGFLGPNGAGKTTTMRCILGLDRPSGGRALVGGRRYADHPAPLSVVGALLDARAAHRSRTARNHLEALAATHRIPRSRVDEVLDATGLSDAAGRKVGGFSLGMGQRLGIAAALLADPATLVLDEPVNGLDPEGVAWVRTFLRRLADEGRTVFLSSHLLSELALVADHVVIIGRGRIIADAPLASLTRDSGRVRVRASDPSALVAHLSRPGVVVTRHGDLVEVAGATAEEVALVARDHGLLLTELTPVRQSLEEAYAALTRDAVEYASA